MGDMAIIKLSRMQFYLTNPLVIYHLFHCRSFKFDFAAYLFLHAQHYFRLESGFSLIDVELLAIGSVLLHDANVLLLPRPACLTSVGKLKPFLHRIGNFPLFNL